MKIRNAELCPKCGERTRIYDKRVKHDRIIRYRECPKCWERYKTVEVDYQVLKDLKAAEKGAVK